MGNRRDGKRKIKIVYYRNRKDKCRKTWKLHKVNICKQSSVVNASPVEL